MQQRWHHYNVAFVDENVDTKKLLNFLVENVVTNRLLISLLKRWQLYMYDKRKWFAFFKITLTLSFHPYHLCGSNNEYDHLFILFNYPYTLLEIVKWCYYIMQLYSLYGIQDVDIQVNLVYSKMHYKRMRKTLENDSKKLCVNLYQ